MFEVGPESRKVKRSTADKVWKFRFCYKVQEKLVVKTAFVCTFKGAEAKNEQTNDKDKMIMSVKQAGLLVMDTFCKLIEFGLGSNPLVALLTPLCGAIFSRDDIESMAQDLDWTNLKVLVTINSSAQSGGHYLPTSDMACAVVCSIVATQGLASRGKNNERKSIVTKILTQYTALKKDYVEEHVVTFGRYANGGLVAGMSANNMIEFFKACQHSDFKPSSIKSAIGNAASLKMRTLKANINSGKYTLLEESRMDDGKTRITYKYNQPTDEDVKSVMFRGPNNNYPGRSDYGRRYHEDDDVDYAVDDDNSTENVDGDAGATA